VRRHVRKVLDDVGWRDQLMLRAQRRSSIISAILFKQLPAVFAVVFLAGSASVH
jgi:hypothetical protein